MVVKSRIVFCKKIRLLAVIQHLLAKNCTKSSVKFDEQKFHLIHDISMNF